MEMNIVQQQHQEPLQLDTQLYNEYQDQIQRIQQLQQFNPLLSSSLRLLYDQKHSFKIEEKTQCCQQEYSKDYIINPCCLTSQCFNCVLNNEFTCIKCHKPNISEITRMSLYCLICYEPLDANTQPIFLRKCRDVFCTYCLKQYVSENINQGRIKQASKCPQCLKKSITNTHLEKLLTQNEYNRIIGLQLKSVAPVDATNEVLKYCPKCDYAEFIDPKAERFNCLICNNKICPNCNSEAPHPGMSCRVYRELQAKLQSEDMKEEIIEGVKKCPQCGFLIERSDGCNFMTCISSNCLRKTYFCYLCGIELKYSQHFSHYRLKGPFGDTCNTMDVISDDENSGSDSDY